VPLRPQAVPRNDMDAVQRQRQAIIAHELDQHPVMSPSIALVDDQRLLWAHGAGWADADARRPARPDTL